MLEILSLLGEERYHHQMVRKAFHHFLSLNDFDFDYSCLRCGHHPPVVIADANWKLAFNIPGNPVYLLAFPGMLIYLMCNMSFTV